MDMASWSNDNFISESELFDLTSSLSSEAIAIFNVLKKIISSELDNFIVFSDYKNVLNALQNVRKIKH